MKLINLKKDKTKKEIKNVEQKKKILYNECMKNKEEKNGSKF